MSDDEDMEGAGPRASLGVASMASITASQLAAAIAAAGGSGQQATPVAVSRNTWSTNLIYQILLIDINTVCQIAMNIVFNQETTT